MNNDKISFDFYNYLKKIINEKESEEEFKNLYLLIN